MSSPNLSDPIIRDARPSDAAAMVGMLDQLGYPDAADSIQEKILKLTDREDARLLVAESNGSVVALISIHFIPQIALKGDFARISYFVVDEQHRNEGLGTRIESELDRLASERGCDRIEVHCHSRRTDAHRFYEALGYEESPKYFIRRLTGK